MQFAAKDTLTEEEVQSGLRAVIRDGMASTAMATLTGGPFLVAFALKLGASNLVIGLMAAISPQAKMRRYSITEIKRNAIRSQTRVFPEHLAGDESWTLRSHTDRHCWKEGCVEEHIS
jgi:hypothetical protein